MSAEFNQSVRPSEPSAPLTASDALNESALPAQPDVLESSSFNVSALPDQTEDLPEATPPPSSTAQADALEDSSMPIALPVGVAAAALVLLIAAIAIVLWMRRLPLAYANTPTGSEIDACFDEDHGDSESSGILVAEQV
jgi:hypothetical protein